MAKLKINRGTTYIRTITYLKDGTITPLTGMTVYFTIKRTEYDADPDDTSAILSKTYSNLSDEKAEAGKVEITIAPTDTALIEPDEYYYDIKLCENPNDDSSKKRIYKLEEGTVVLDGSPTNRAV